MATVEKKISSKAAGKGGPKCRCCLAHSDRVTFRRRVKRGKLKEHTRKEIDAQEPRWDKRKASFVLDDEDAGEGLL